MDVEYCRAGEADMSAGIGSGIFWDIVIVIFKVRQSKSSILEGKTIL